MAIPTDHNATTPGPTERGLTFPIRLRCRYTDDLFKSTALEDAVTRALGRAFAHARQVLPVAKVLGSGVVLARPELVKGNLAPDEQAALLSLLGRAIERAARNQALPITILPQAGRVAGGAAVTALASEASEPFDPARFDEEKGEYLVPFYQKAGQKQPVQLAPKGGTPAVVAQLDKDDGTLFQQILSGTRFRPGRGAPDPVNLEIMRAFARGNPARFRKLLLEAVTASATAIGRVYELSEGGLKIIDKDKQALQEAKLRLDITADAIHLAGELPEANWLSGELDRRVPGFLRIVALLEPIATAQLNLLSYLSPVGEKWDESLIEALKGFDLWRYPALLATLAGGQQGISSYRPQEELLTYYRALVAVLPKLQEIDRHLLIYRLSFGPAAEKIEEVDVLRQARSQYVELLFDATPGNAFRRHPVSAQLDDADKFYADWRGLAHDKKVEHGTAALKELKQKVADIPLFYKGLGRNNAYGEFNTTLGELLQEVTRTLGEKHLKRTPGKYDVEVAQYLQHRLRELEVKYSLLTFWKGMLDLPVWGEMGSDEEWQYWYDHTHDLRSEIKKQYAKPDYANLPDKMNDWARRFDSLIKYRNDAAEAQVKENKRKFWSHLVITVVAMVVTRRVAGLAELRWGLSAAEITLVGAGTFTALTTLGQAILREEVTGRDVLVSLSENASFGFLFGWLNVRFVAFGRYLAPGRDLAQLAVVLGADAAVGAGVNVGLNLIRTGDLPEDIQSFVFSSVVLAATGALLGGSRLRTQLRKLNVRDDLLAQFDRLSQEGAAIFDEMRKIGLQGPDEAQHGSLKQRLLRVLPDLENVLKRLGGAEFSDADLASLGLSRPQVKVLTEIVAQYFGIVRKSQWSPLSGRPGAARAGSARRLPAPSVVVHDLVAVGPDAFEYNPYVPAQSADQVTALFQQSGYKVTDTGGGVLRLTGQGMDRPLLLLPGRPSVPPPSLAIVVGGYDVKAQRRALEVLQAQPDVAKYVAQLTSVAQGSQLTAQRLLRAIGRFLGPQHTVELQGLSHFLEVGGTPSVLAKVLSPADTGEWFIDVQKALRTMGSFSPQAAQGLETFFDLRSGTTASAALRVFHNFEPQQIVGIFESLQRLAPHSSDLGRLIPDLTGNVPQKYKAVVGVLLAANKELDRFPDAHLAFEDPTLAPGGELRVSDFRVFRPGAFLTRRVEVKEIYELSSLGSDAVRQLATDIILEVTERRTLSAGSRPFESIDWRIRGQEIAASAARRLKISDVNDPAVRRQVIEDVKGRLRPALDHAVIKRAIKSGHITEAELAEYRNTFEAGLPFVSFN